MSKRFKAEIEFKKNIKEEEFNIKLLHNIKVAERKQKEKNKNLNANDFPIIKEIPEHRDRNLWKRKSYNKDKQIEEFIGYTYFKYEAPFWAIKYIEYIISGINNIIERNPNLKMFNAVIHLDEETPHLHLDYIPFAEYQKGLKKRNSLGTLIEKVLTNIDNQVSLDKIVYGYNSKCFQAQCLATKNNKESELNNILENFINFQILKSVLNYK